MSTSVSAQAETASPRVTPRPVVETDRVSLSFPRPDGRLQPALDDISLRVHTGEIVVLIGPSGCGKSTFLRVVAGVLRRYEGSVTHWDESGSECRPAVPMVEQTPALLPWRTVRENILLLSELRYSPRHGRAIDASALIERVGLHGFDNDKPSSLSGGMRTRVAIARALAVAERLILLDEAFSDLDEVTRLRLITDFCWHVTVEQLAVIAVSHNVEEAALLADRIIILSRRPARVLREVHVDIARPRRVDGPEYRRVQGLGAQLREEVMQLWQDVL